MSANKLDRSMPIFALLEQMVLPYKGGVYLTIASWPMRVKWTTQYIPMNADECDFSYIPSVHWGINVSVMKKYLIQYDTEDDSLSVGVHLVEMDNNNHTEYYIQKLETHTIWPKPDDKPVSRLDRSMPIFELLEQMERPYNGEVRLFINSYKRKHWVDKKYSIKYDSYYDSLSVGIHIYERNWECSESEHMYDNEYEVSTYETNYIW
jgi:hypothetical protein